MVTPFQRRRQGLTLIELLVTLAITALLGLMSWRAIDGMSRTREITDQHSNQWQTWQTAVAQWMTDLDALQEPGFIPALDFDGRVLRLVRRDTPSPNGGEEGLRVVAWAVRTDTAHPNPGWSRWSSIPVQSRSELARAWNEASAWGHAEREVPGSTHLWLTPVTRWQLFYHRGGAWANPLSASGAPGNDNKLPDGIRLQISLPEQGTPNGEITVDWARPTLTGEKAP